MKRLIVSIFALAVFVVPAVLFAAGLVPCDGPSCRACDIVTLGNNILTWFIGFATAVIALVFAIGGMKMVMSAGNTESVSSAKSMMTNAVIGFVILLTAWLIIDTILKTLIADNFFPGSSTSEIGPWNTMECITPPGRPAPAPAGTVTTVTPGTVGTAGCPDCTAIPAGIPLGGNVCSGGGPCTVSATIADELLALDGQLDASGIDWRVTEAYPPTVTHSNPCHAAGTCVDASINNQTVENLSTFMDKAKTSGLRPVYEGNDCGVRDQLRSAGYEAFCRSDSGYGHITGTHFSLYKGQ